MTEIEIVAYIGVFFLAMIFSLLGVGQKSSVSSLISWICWHCLAAFHLAFLYDSVIIYALWLYVGIGWLFFVLGLGQAIAQMGGKPDKTLELS